MTDIIFYGIIPFIKKEDILFIELILSLVSKDCYNFLNSDYYLKKRFKQIKYFGTSELTEFRKVIQSPLCLGLSIESRLKKDIFPLVEQFMASSILLNEQTCGEKIPLYIHEMSLKMVDFLKFFNKDSSSDITCVDKLEFIVCTCKTSPCKCNTIEFYVPVWKSENVAGNEAMGKFIQIYQKIHSFILVIFSKTDEDAKQRKNGGCEYRVSAKFLRAFNDLFEKLLKIYGFM